MHIIGFLRATKLTFVKKQPEAGDVYTFFFSPAQPLKHIAGQHGLFVLPGLRGLHIFSLSSAPEERYVSLTTHVRPQSRYKRFLAGLQPGDHLTLWGPVLDFIFQKNATDYIFVAQGIGITPFRSLLVHASDAKLPVSTTLIHVDSSSHLFQELTHQLASRAYYPADADAFTKLVGETLTPRALYYLSGSPKFVRATKRTLRSLGVKRSHTRSDSFLGY